MIEIMSFTVTWTDWELIIQSEIGQRKKNTQLYHLYVEFKYDTNEHIYETKTRLMETEQTYDFQESGYWEGGISIWC